MLETTISKATLAFRKSLTPQNRRKFDKVQLELAQENVNYHTNVRLADAKRNSDHVLIEMIEATISMWQAKIEFYSPPKPQGRRLVITLDFGTSREKTFSVSCPLNVEAYVYHFLAVGRKLQWRIVEA